MTAPMTVRVGAWTFHYGGGRLADVHHASAPGDAVDCVQAGPYDWATGTPHVTRATLTDAAHEWAADHGAEYMDNVVAYNGSGWRS